ncbi:hypothetical protein FH972_019478 [Carpinus fangiana]|uniref:Uncharacterized protein n=1 Tax=Carpinus fangiana TaxID=176857 RepID=A0A5N6RT86_9ROSI|nr:hypothetical protein FH972_019478 [Carpinus fangiana]
METWVALSIVTVVVVVLKSAWRVLRWVWVRPKTLERCLREQGLTGNSYRLFFGDLKEISKMTILIENLPPQKLKPVTTAIKLQLQLMTAAIKLQLTAFIPKIIEPDSSTHIMPRLCNPFLSRLCAQTRSQESSSTFLS